MPKINNGHRSANTASTPGTVGQRLARKANGIEDPRRLKLITQILDESSSPALNDLSSQQAGPIQVAEQHSHLLSMLDELRQLESHLNPKMPCRDDKSWRTFFEWVDTNSQAQVSSRVGVRKQSSFVCSQEQDNDEFSLVAKVPIKKGERVFKIDRNLLLTTETSTKDLDLHDFIKKDTIASGMQNVVLVLHLLNEYSKREQSFWWPYLSILPSKVLPVLRMNQKFLLRYLLASTHIYEALKLLRSIARQYSYFYQRLQSTRLPLRRCFTFEYYTWGVSCVCSRQNEIPMGLTTRESRLSVPYHSAHAFIPVLDMCNHDPRSNQAAFLDDSSCLLADDDIQPGEEITINYGSQSRSSGEFYIHNGFVPEILSTAPENNLDAASLKSAPVIDKKVPSNYDVVPISIGLNPNDKLHDKKAKLLKILNMPTFGRFKLILNTYENRHKRDPHLAMFLIVNSLNENELNLILDDLNPVGVADEIYEYVHYKDYTSHEKVEPCMVPSVPGEQKSDTDKQAKLDEMKKRVAKSVKDYLSLKSKVSVILINRTLKEITDEQDQSVDHYAVRLLQCEKRIFESYL